jgi:uncharacterized protein (TIGR03437 family)
MTARAKWSLFFLLAANLRAQTPVVSAGGVVDAASFRAPVVPGSLVSIFGSNLAPAPAAAASIPLPGKLGPVSVTFNGVTAPLLYVSPGQINAQLPWEVSAAGPVSVIVTNGDSSSMPQPVQVAAVSPSVFGFAGHALAANLDGSLAAPATPGDTIVLLATGLGAVTPTPITGHNSLDALRIAATLPAISIAGVPARVTFAGLSPQFVGVYQINVVVPASAPPASATVLEIGSAAQLPISIGAGWPQWGHDSQHANNAGIAGQNLEQILASIPYDPLVAEEKAASENSLTVHYQVPLVDGNDVYMEFKTGTLSPTSYASQTWGESKFTWRDGQLVAQVAILQRLETARRDHRFLGTSISPRPRQRRTLCSGHWGRHRESEQVHRRPPPAHRAIQ